jgi:hypothetical protein
MYVILYDKKDKKNSPGYQPSVMSNSLYFDEQSAKNDCAALNAISKQYVYTVYRLKEL